ncbi:hypothetical protein F4604DRAFT_1112691 [Suillus subluteus]|nr:hypothetical protein F4604DRAFT_1112691 [Suillus subluteus]
MCYLQWIKRIEYQVFRCGMRMHRTVRVSHLFVCLSVCPSLSLTHRTHFSTSYFNILRYGISPQPNPIPPVHARIHASHRITIILSFFFFFSPSVTLVLNCLGCVLVVVYAFFLLEVYTYFIHVCLSMRFRF